MKICSVTICPPDEQAKEALESVKGLVDERHLFSALPQPISDFSAARNEVLAFAHDRGFDLAIMLDTDERLVLNTSDWTDPDLSHREALESVVAASPEVDVWMTPHVSGTYAKERIFRLPARGHYEGPVHECFVLDPGSRREDRAIEWIAFDEVPKDPSELEEKLRRDDAILRDYIEGYPFDPRWWYYRGDTRANMGDWPLALDCFQECWRLDGWDEESAWAMYRAAGIHAESGEYQWALECCTQGMLRHPGMVELPWLAGWCCYHLGRYQHAIWWEQQAAALNDMRAGMRRVGFRHPPALYEGPYDVMRWAYAALGDTVGRDLAEAMFHEREKMRSP